MSHLGERGAGEKEGGRREKSGGRGRRKGEKGREREESESGGDEGVLRKEMVRKTNDHRGEFKGRVVTEPATLGMYVCVGGKVIHSFFSSLASCSHLFLSLLQRTITCCLIYVCIGVEENLIRETGRQGETTMRHSQKKNIHRDKNKHMHVCEMCRSRTAWHR